MPGPAVRIKLQGIEAVRDAEILLGFRDSAPKIPLDAKKHPCIDAGLIAKTGVKEKGPEIIPVGGGGCLFAGIRIPFPASGPEQDLRGRSPALFRGKESRSSAEEECLKIGKRLCESPEGENLDRKKREEGGIFPAFPEAERGSCEVSRLLSFFAALKEKEKVPALPQRKESF